MRKEVAHQLVEQAIDHVGRSLRAGDLANAMLGINQAAHVLEPRVGVELAAFRCNMNLDVDREPVTSSNVIDMAAWLQQRAEARHGT